MNNKKMRMCIARKGVKDLPILVQSLSAVLLEELSAVFMADWRTVLDKSACVKKNAKQSLSLMLTKPSI